MDLTNPMGAVIPGAQGSVLAVWARTHVSLSGRKVAELTNPKVGHAHVNELLAALTRAGLVLSEDHPPAKAYRLNRAHVAVPAIEALANQWIELLHRIRQELATWELAPLSACVFGSAARGEAGIDSDVDLLLVPPPEVADFVNAERTWVEEIERLSQRVWE